MAYSLVVKQAAGSSDGLAVTTPSVDTTGANLLVLVLSGLSGSTGGPTDSKSNTWTALTAEDVGGGERCTLYYCFNPTAGSGHTFSWTPSAGGRPSICVLAFADATLTSPFDQESGGNNFGSTAQPASLTPSVNGCVVVEGLAGNVAGTLTINGGFTFAGDATDYINKDASNHMLLGAAYLFQTTAGAVAPTWTHSPGSVSLAVRQAVFKPAAGGGGGTAHLLGTLGVGG